jgi:SHS2 domain-containing protein
LYVDATDAAEIDRCTVHLAAGSDDALLLDLLEEVIFTLDTAEGVPVRAEVTSVRQGGLDADLVLADPLTMEATGAVPKAVSRFGLKVTTRPAGVRCRFLVDV